MFNIGVRGLDGTFKVEKLVLNQARRNDDVVYGARSLNRQLHYPFMERKTTDWDLFTRHPKKSAVQMRNKLGPNHYIKPAMFPGTWKVKNAGKDKVPFTKDDFTIVDYSKMKPLKTVRIEGVRYSTFSEIKKDRRRSLRNPDAYFRHQADKKDLRLISANESLRRRGRY